jgi:NDP-sugar pyrophosphorylase family protein
MKAVILAGGKGTRLVPYTSVFPKPLLPLGDMLILEIMIYQMRKAGITDIILTVGHLAHLISTYFNSGKRFGVEISYSHEEIPLGTSGPLSLIDGLDDTFLVTNGDILSDIPLKDLIKSHKQSDAVATIAMYNREVKIDMGVIELDRENEVVGYLEKPDFVYPVSMGIYVFEPKVLEYIPNNQYFDFPDLVLKLIENDEQVVGFPFSGYWRDLGRPGDYEDAALDFSTMRERFLPED